MSHTSINLFPFKYHISIYVFVVKKGSVILPRNIYSTGWYFIHDYFPYQAPYIGNMVTFSSGMCITYAFIYKSNKNMNVKINVLLDKNDTSFFIPISKWK